MLYSLARRLLFCLPAEASHALALRALAAYAYLPGRRPPTPGAGPVELFGCRFANRVGLAAGLDKDARALGGLTRLGFGFVEVGTVTPQPQPGNDKPRLFRLPAQRALINRMGFNNEGVDAMHARLEAARRRGWCDGVVVGVNLGKNKDTPLEHAVSDYVFGMRRLYLQADYFTLNLSSPNTPGLRRLQGGAALGNLLTEIKSQQALLAQEHQRVVPVLIKVAPDLSTSELKEVAGLCVHHQIDGVIATNTTLSREGVAGARHGDESGGLSGAPVHGRAVATVARLRTLLPRHVPVIGVGGIDSAIAGERMLEAGADLLQIYTGFIYEGPTLVHKLRRLCGSRRTSD